MLPGLPGESAAVGRPEIGKGLAQVGEGQTPAARERREPEIAQAAAEPFRGGTGQTPDAGGQRPQEEVDGLLRSRTTSMTIGITESTITTTTIRWRWRPMLGIAWPSRYPAHVMLITHPTPPATL